MARHAKPLTSHDDVIRFVDRHNLAALRKQLVDRPARRAGSYNAERDIVPAYLMNEAGYFVHDNAAWHQAIRVTVMTNDLHESMSAEALGLKSVPFD